ncbi:MAG: hypothetical protein ACYTGN_11620, partial [Planctomycetota bacterium]
MFFFLAQPARSWIDGTRYLGPPLRVAAMTLWPVYSTAPPVEAEAGSLLDLKQAHDSGLAAISELEEPEVEKVVVKNAGLSPILVRRAPCSTAANRIARSPSLVTNLGKADVARYAAIRAHLTRHPDAVGYAVAVRAGRGAVRAYSTPKLLASRLDTIARTLAHES